MGKLSNYDVKFLKGTLTVNKASTTVQVASSASTVDYGQPVTFTPASYPPAP